MTLQDGARVLVNDRPAEVLAVAPDGDVVVRYDGETRFHCVPMAQVTEDLASKLLTPNGYHSLGAECACGWLERECESESARDGDAAGHERRMEEIEALDADEPYTDANDYTLARDHAMATGEAA